MTTPFTYSENTIDEFAVEIVTRVNGQINNTGTRRIFEDGQTMILDIKAFLPGGQEIPLVLVFHRQSQ